MRSGENADSAQEADPFDKSSSVGSTVSKAFVDPARLWLARHYSLPGPPSV